MIKKIGVLTGGGDTTVLNAQVAKIVEIGNYLGVEVFGFYGGWLGLLKKEGHILQPGEIDPWFGGSDIENTRTKLKEEDYKTAIKYLEDLEIEGLIPIGGDDTLSLAKNLDFPITGIIKTIDNDVGTKPPANSYDFEKMLSYFTLGFMKAAFAANDFIAGEYGLITTARSHKRTILMETMGAKSGWLALSTYPSKPDMIIIGEYPIKRDLDDLAKRIIDIYDSKEKKPHVMVVVAENAKYEDNNLIAEDKSRISPYGKPQLGGAAEILKTALSNHPKIKERFKEDTRIITAVTPGHLYRSGKPLPKEKELAENIATAAVLYLINEKRGVVGVGYHSKRFYPQLIDPNKFPTKEDGSIEERIVDDRFYNPKMMGITDQGKRYFTPILSGIEEKIHFHHE